MKTQKPFLTKEAKEFLKAEHKFITWDEFEEKYNPIEKSEGNILFDTFGEDAKKVKEAGATHIWTLLDTGKGIYLANGYWFINRMNYVITKKPFTEIRGTIDIKY